MTLQIIAGEFKKRKLYAPKTDLTRPSKNALRETLFNICAPYIEDATFLDLFAGSGAIGFEALSRGAAKVIFVENQKMALQAIWKNALLLKVENRIEILDKSVYSVLSKTPCFCDLIFADPPYHQEAKEPEFYKLFEILDAHPILNEKGRFFLETHKKASPYPKELKTLQFLKQRKIGNSQLFEYQSIASFF